MSVKNLAEARALVERYRALTLDEVERTWTRFNHRWHVRRVLTGFGDPEYCTLCLAAITCEVCVYWPGHCNRSIYSDSYGAIRDAESPQALLTAFRARADVLEARIREYEETE